MTAQAEKIGQDGPKWAEFLGQPIEMVTLVPDLVGTPFYTEYIGEEWFIPTELRGLSERRVEEIVRQGKRVTNGIGVALTHIVDGGEIMKFIFRQVQYFDHIGTNGFLDLELGSGQTVRGKYGGIETHNTIEGFNRSPYARLAGVSTVVVTSDEHILITLRSGKTAIVANNWHVSVAEGMKKEHVDPDGNIDPRQTVMSGLRQELDHSAMFSKFKG